MNRRHKPDDEEHKIERTIEDDWQDQMWAAASAAVVKQIKAILAVDPHRMLRTLQRTDIDKLVGAATWAYATKRAELEEWEREHADELKRDRVFR